MGDTARRSSAQMLSRREAVDEAGRRAPRQRLRVAGQNKPGARRAQLPAERMGSGVHFFCCGLRGR